MEVGDEQAALALAIRLPPNVPKLREVLFGQPGEFAIVLHTIRRHKTPKTTAGRLFGVTPFCPQERLSQYGHNSKNRSTSHTHRVA